MTPLKLITTETWGTDLWPDGPIAHIIQQHTNQSQPYEIYCYKSRKDFKSGFIAKKRTSPDWLFAKCVIEDFLRNPSTF